MTGRWARANPDLVKRIARDHDTFLNHTFDHESFTGLSTGLRPLSAAQRSWEIRQTETVVHRITGGTTKPYFRPPFGDYDAATLRLVRGLGYRYMVMWTVDSLGWQRLPAARILSRCLSLARPGSIFLMHVGIQSQDAQALEPLVTSLRRRGYRFVTIPQLVAGS
jgi:peptidoglycan/xylan/chitin deacetylase (PgdA/CDA1 family)